MIELAEQRQNKRQEMVAQVQQRMLADTDSDVSNFMEHVRDLADWPFLIDMAGYIRQYRQLYLVEQLALAEAYWIMGYLNEANTELTSLLLAHPYCSTAIQLDEKLQQWNEQSQALLHSHAVSASQLTEVCQVTCLPCKEHATPLYLQLLGPQHYSSFIGIYSGNTAELCCLPEFVDEADWQQWLEEQRAQEDQITFAVMHPDIGMVGVVSLVINGRSGFFYYWITESYRGMGLGPFAVSILFNFASIQWGIQTYYAKVYHYNQSSRRGLEKLGFTALDIAAAPPYDQEIFYRLGADIDDAMLLAQMYHFYDGIGCWKPFTKPLPSAAVMAQAHLW